MQYLLFFLGVLVSFSFCQNELPADCKLPLDMGNTPCKGGKREIRYHFDKNSNLPLAFEYTGCGGNKNNFKTEVDCKVVCLGEAAFAVDYVGCAAGRPPLKIQCETDKDCGPKGFCQYQYMVSICCDKEIDKKYQADWNPKCPKGKKVVKAGQEESSKAIVGKTCKSNFCPVGATCIEGNYFATCCK